MHTRGLSHGLRNQLINHHQSRRQSQALITSSISSRTATYLGSLVFQVQWLYKVSYQQMRISNILIKGCYSRNYFNLYTVLITVYQNIIYIYLWNDFIFYNIIDFKNNLFLLLCILFDKPHRTNHRYRIN